MKNFFTENPILLLNDGLFISAGSCIHENKNFDIYIGFDDCMFGETVAFSKNINAEKLPVRILFNIEDMSIPSDIESFNNLLFWTINKLKEGFKIHVGCFLGIGRTGLFLSAIVKEMLNIDDAITYVREHYNEKAVETKIQEEFLVNNFNILPTSRKYN